MFLQDQREPESAIRLFGVDLLAGLQQIHACGFLHGDLRPSNVLIDEYGILKLSGFGQARSIAELNQPGASKGTRDERSVSSGGAAAGSGGNPKWRGDPGYRAPELFSEGPQAMSFASDFWSLGCILFELLTGEPPFCGSSHSSIEEVVKREVRICCLMTDSEAEQLFGIGPMCFFYMLSASHHNNVSATDAKAHVT